VISRGLGKEQRNPQIQKISRKMGKILIAVIPGEMVQHRHDDILHFPKTPGF